MRDSVVPALLTAVFTLACANSIASEEIAPESVKPLHDPAHFNRLCEELMRQVLQQGNVEFAESSAELGTNALGTLDEIVEIAFDCPSLSITVTGHTDNTGNEAANRALSKARAESVVTYLTKRGIEPERLTASGVGSAVPIASNEDALGRQVNRRIEFEVGTDP